VKRTHTATLRKKRATVQSVERAFDLLEALAAAKGELGILDLSECVHLHPSTVHRLLATLVQRGYVRQSPLTGRYALGARVLQFSRFYDQTTLRVEAYPFLERLVRASGETTNLSILDHDEAVYIDQVQSPHLVRMFAQIGRRVPLHSTGCGKILLAYLEPAERARIIREKGLPACTRNTITNPQELGRVLAQVRRCGYAVDNEEMERGVRCVAGPVRDHTGKVIAAISISGPVTRMTKERIPQLSKLVVNVCRELSMRFGYRET
jgi:DNA-binding IclR family transcriptional regulator